MIQYIVTGMSCAACSARVEKAVSKVPGVTSCSVSLLTNSMGVEGTATEQEIIKIFRMLTEEFGKTVIVVTHSNVVSQLSDHRVVLNEGQLKDM